MICKDNIFFFMKDLVICLFVDLILFYHKVHKDLPQSTQIQRHCEAQSAEAIQKIKKKDKNYPVRNVIFQHL